MVQPTANAQQTFCRSCDKIVEESEKIIYKKCKHVFHQACVELNKKKVQGSCNNCESVREYVPVEDQMNHFKEWITGGGFFMSLPYDHRRGGFH